MTSLSAVRVSALCLLASLAGCSSLSEEEALEGVQSAATETASGYRTLYAGDFDFSGETDCSDSGTVAIDSGWSLLGLSAEVNAELDECSDGDVASTGTIDLAMDIDVNVETLTVALLGNLTAELEFEATEWSGPCEVEVDLEMEVDAAAAVFGDFVLAPNGTVTVCGYDDDAMVEAFVDPIYDMVAESFSSILAELPGLGD